MWESVTHALGSDLQHTQTVDARHRITVADQVAPIPAVLAQPPLPLFFAYGPVVHRQVFHPSSPALSCAPRCQPTSSLSEFYCKNVLTVRGSSWGLLRSHRPALLSFFHSVWQHLSPPSNLVAAVKLCSLTCAHTRLCVPKCLFCVGFRKWSFFFFDRK